MKNVLKTIEKIELELNLVQQYIEKLKLELLLVYEKDKTPKEKEPLTIENLSSENSILGILTEVLEDSTNFNTPEKVIRRLKAELSEIESNQIKNLQDNNLIKISDIVEELE